jgi:hypothetical protein
MMASDVNWAQCAFSQKHCSFCFDTASKDNQGLELTRQKEKGGWSSWRDKQNKEANKRPEAAAKMALMIAMIRELSEYTQLPSSIHHHA